MRMPFAVECLDGGGRRLLDRVGDTHDAGRLPVHGDEHHRLSLRAQRLGALGQRPGFNAQGLQEPQVAERHPLAVHLARDPFSGDRIEGLRLAERDASLVCTSDDSHLAVYVPKRGRENTGHHGRHKAVAVCDAGAEPDEREHVQTAVDDGLPAPHEERPAAPQHHGRAESELHPAERTRRGRASRTRGRPPRPWR